MTLSVVVLDIAEVHSYNSDPLTPDMGPVVDGRAAKWCLRRPSFEHQELLLHSQKPPKRTSWGSILKLKIILWWSLEQHGRRLMCSQRLHKPFLALMTLLSRTRLLLTHCIKKVSDERLQLPLAHGVRTLDHVRRKKQGHLGTRAFYRSTIHFVQMNQGKNRIRQKRLKKERRKTYSP